MKFNSLRQIPTSVVRAAKFSIFDAQCVISLRINTTEVIITH